MWQQRLLSVLSSLPPPYPRPWLCFRPQPQPRTLFLRRNRVVRCKGPPEGDGPTQTLHPRRHYSQAFCSSDCLECRTDTGTLTSRAHMPGCPASSLCGHRVQLVLDGKEGNETGFSFRWETGFPSSRNTHQGRCPELRPESWVGAETCEYTPVQVHMCISTDMYTHTTYTHVGQVVQEQLTSCKGQGHP